MKLHFNLTGMFLFCVGLMLWQALFHLTGVVGMVSVCIMLFYLYWQNRLNWADGIFATSFLLNLWYVLSSWGHVRQYDYFNFFMHADYFVMHDFFVQSPISYLQSVYFQPPLWGLICGAVTKLMMIFGYSKEAGFDFVRFISLFAISGTGIIFWRMLDKFEIREKLGLVIFALFLFLPINGIAANLVNNDAMVYFLMLAIIWQSFLWYENSSWQSCFIIGGLLFVGTMIKFSALMVLPAIGVLGLFKLIKSENKLSLKLWGQFSFIGLGAVLGFLWGILLLYHHLPLTPPPLNNDFQNMESYTMLQRMFSFAYVGVPFADVRAGGIEPNVWLTLIKTSLFGEWTWQGIFWAYLLYGISIVWAVVFVWSLMYLPKLKFGKDYTFNCFFIVLLFSVLVAWINFWIDYPYFCSTEFRYVIILLPMGLLWLASFLSQKSLPKAFDYTFAGFVVLMIFARIMLYLHTI